MKVKVKWNCGNGDTRRVGEKKPPNETTALSVDEAMRIVREKMDLGYRKIVLRFAPN